MRALHSGNHWLDDRGDLVRLYDGRAPLPVLLSPNNSVDLNLEITAPPLTGPLSFGTGCRARGSRLVRKQGLANFAASSPRRRNDAGRNDDATFGSHSGNHTGTRQATLQDVVFEDHMHCIPRADVLQLLRSAGGYLFFIQPSGCSGPAIPELPLLCSEGRIQCGCSTTRMRRAMNLSAEAESYSTSDSFDCSRTGTHLPRGCLEAGLLWRFLWL